MRGTELPISRDAVANHVPSQPVSSPLTPVVTGPRSIMQSLASNGRLVHDEHLLSGMEPFSLEEHLGIQEPTGLPSSPRPPLHPSTRRFRHETFSRLRALASLPASDLNRQFALDLDILDPSPRILTQGALLDGSRLTMAGLVLHGVDSFNGLDPPFGRGSVEESVRAVRRSHSPEPWDGFRRTFDSNEESMTLAAPDEMSSLWSFLEWREMSTHVPSETSLATFTSCGRSATSDDLEEPSGIHTPGDGASVMAEACGSQDCDDALLDIHDLDGGLRSADSSQKSHLDDSCKKNAGVSDYASESIHMSQEHRESARNTTSSNESPVGEDRITFLDEDRQSFIESSAQSIFPPNEPSTPMPAFRRQRLRQSFFR